MADPTLLPICEDLPSLLTGDTLPAINYKFEGFETTLASVTLKVYPVNSTTAALSLANGSGITINDAGPDPWDFDLDRIATVTLDPGVYHYYLTCTDSAGDIRTEIEGSWVIKKNKG